MVVSGENGGGIGGENDSGVEEERKIGLRVKQERKIVVIWLLYYERIFSLSKLVPVIKNLTPFKN